MAKTVSKKTLKEKINFAVVSVGTKYSIDYIEKLYNSIERNCTLDYEFHVFSDKSINYKDAIFHMLPEMPVPKTDLKGWWYKLCLFDKTNGLSGKIFYLDLDCVIIGNIDHLIEPTDEFYICQDFNRCRNSSITLLNSSCMQWTPNEHTHKIWSQWQSTITSYINLHRGDQDYLARECNWIDFKFNNKDAIVSYKWEACNNFHNRLQDMNLTPTVLDSHRIYVFHGKPDPHEVFDSIIVDHWK